LGGINSSCREGYTGVLCGDCTDDYAKYGAVQCRECGATYTEGFLSVMLVLCFLIWGYLVLNSTASNPSFYNPTLVIWRNLTDYIQSILLVLSLNSPMVPEFDMYLSVIATPFRFVWGNHGIECLLEKKNSNRFTEGFKFTAFAPFIFIGPYFLVGILLFGWKMCRGTPIANLKSFMISAMLLLATFIYPGAANLAISVFNCVEYREGKKYLVNNMNLECGSSEHSELINTYAIINLIVIVICKSKF
jgi:hypothetical protein